MKQQLRDEWVKALRSGEYEQHFHALWNTNQTAFCCLGVLCEVADAQGVCEQSFSEMIAGEGFTDAPAKLVQLNDEQRAPFAVIADWIEANIPVTP